MNQRTILAILALSGSALAAACGDDPSSLTAGAPNDPSAQSPDGSADPGDPASCKGREYLGFDGRNLTQGREVARLGENRRRVKPFSALSSEYARVLGAAPASLSGAGAAFGNSPARWFEEAESNSVALQTNFGIAFDGCLAYVGNAPDMKAPPTPESAGAACAAMQRKFWSRTPTPAQVKACADAAVATASKETELPRKWAYACAAVLTSAEFLTY